MVCAVANLPAESVIILNGKLFFYEPKNSLFSERSMNLTSSHTNL